MPMRLIAVLGLGILAACTTVDLHARQFSTSAGPVEVEQVAGDLDTPWAVAFLPDGGLLVTERDGRLWHFDAAMARNPVAGVPDVYVQGQGGLLDVVAARDFTASRTIFLTYAGVYPGGGATTLASARLSADGSRLEELRVLFRQDRATGAGHHFGSRVVEAPDGSLYLTIGDRGDADRAQDPQTHNGKVVRVNRDGSVPADNPFASGGGRPDIWSIGHRNPQGATLDEAGRLWTVEHGARGGDEINRPQAGHNHGWPVISYGTHYSGMPIGEGTAKSGMEQPVWYWDPSIAPSGMAILSGRLFPAWTGDILVGSLKYDYVSRLDRDGDRVSGEERLFPDAFERIRDVREGPDGAIWFLSEGDGALYRVTPVR
ncbi:MAG: PQQ-dependent sugar dehydrogenase [Pseudomonadota bacterium]|nr:PQQ-dependent sugar dehydrogenase [Pseudomonadota bacterium]